MHLALDHIELLPQASAAEPAALLLPAVDAVHDHGRPAPCGPGPGTDEIALVGVADLPFEPLREPPPEAIVVLRHGAAATPPLGCRMAIRFHPDPTLVSELPVLGGSETRTWRLDPMQHAAIAELFSRIRTESAGSRPGRAHATSAWLRILLTMVARLEAPAGSDPDGPRQESDPEVQLLCRAIDARRRGLAHGPLAEAVPNYDALRHRFLRIYGESPNQMLLRTRIETAKDLLVRTDRSMAEIARATGYTRQHELARAFHRVVGCTPTAWRRRARATSGRV